MSAHSDFGGSVAEKWLNCDGYVQAVQGMPPQLPTIHTVGGTAQHALVEHLTKTGENPESFIGKKWMGDIPPNFRDVYDEDNVARARVWIDAIHEHCDPMRFNLWIEKKVVLSSIAPELNGNADLIGVDEANHVLVVADYKDGGGHIVDIETTPQLPFYAVGADDTLKLNLDATWTVKLLIVQPKAPNPVTWKIITGRDIAEWRGVFRRAYHKSMQPGATRTAGDHCHWCRVAICAARADAKRMLIRKEFAGPTLPQDLTMEQMGNILRVAPEVEAWLDSVQKYALERALGGYAVPGFKLVEGRAGAREWSDEEAAERELVLKLGDQAYNRKLLSPTQAEKTLGKDGLKPLARLITQDAGKPTLAVEGSERDNYSKQAQARADFAT